MPSPPLPSGTPPSPRPSPCPARSPAWSSTCRFRRGTRSPGASPSTARRRARGVVRQRPAARPTRWTPRSSSSPTARITATDARAWVPCSYSGAGYASPWTFTAQLYPGAYTIEVSPYASPPLPTWSTTVSTTFAVAAAQSGVVFDVQHAADDRLRPAHRQRRDARRPRLVRQRQRLTPNAMDAANSSSPTPPIVRLDAAYVGAVQLLRRWLCLAVDLLGRPLPGRVPGRRLRSSPPLPSWSTVVVDRLRVPSTRGNPSGGLICANQRNHSKWT